MDNTLEKICKRILNLHLDKVQVYREGDRSTFSVFVGMVMSETRGEFDPQKVSGMLSKILHGDTCEHKSFHAKVNVGRLSEKEGGPITQYTAEVEIKCNECGLPFEFIGVANGFSPDRPMASADFKTLNVPIRPDTGAMATSLSYKVRPDKTDSKNVN